MTIKEIKNGLLDQARDKEALANHDDTSIFAHDAQVLKEAAKYIEELEGRITAIEAKASKLVNATRCKDCAYSAIDALSERRMCARHSDVRPDGRVYFGTVVDDMHFCGYGETPDEMQRREAAEQEEK